MKNIFWPMPVTNLIADYKDGTGLDLNQVFQVFISDPKEAAVGVHDLLQNKGYTLCSIIQIIGDYTIGELQRIADGEQREQPEYRVFYLNPAEVLNCNTHSTR